MLICIKIPLIRYVFLEITEKTFLITFLFQKQTPQYLRRTGDFSRLMCSKSAD